MHHAVFGFLQPTGKKVPDAYPEESPLSVGTRAEPQGLLELVDRAGRQVFLPLEMWPPIAAGLLPVCVKWAVMSGVDAPDRRECGYGRHPHPRAFAASPSCAMPLGARRRVVSSALS